MKVSIVNIAISLFFTVLLSPQFAAAQGGHPAKPINELIAELKSSTDTAKKNENLRLLRQSEPQTAKDKDLIIDLIENDDADIKCAAMDVMGKIKEKKAVKKIISNLKDKKPNVKVHAAAVLGEIGDVRALDAMLDDIDLIVLEFGHCPAARIGASALSELVDVAKKIDILGVLNPKQGKKSIRSRKAAYCIGQIRDEKAVPMLMKLLKENDEDVRLGTVGALAAMKVKEAEPEFEKMLDTEKNRWTREKIIRVLSFSNKEKYLPKVYEIMEKDKLIRYSMANLLGDLKEKGAVEKLEKLLVDDYGLLRHAAAVALWKITGKVYKYEKDSFVQGWDERWIRRIKDEYERFKMKMEDFDKQRASGKMSEEMYRFYKDHETEELLKKGTLEGLRKEAQEQGYLLEYGSVDAILEEIKKNPGKYEWR